MKAATGGGRLEEGEMPFQPPPETGRKRKHEEVSSSMQIARSRRKTETWKGGEEGWSTGSQTKTSWRQRRNRVKKLKLTAPKIKKNILKGMFVNIGNLNGLDEYSLLDIFEEANKKELDFFWLSEVELQADDHNVNRHVPGWSLYEYLREDEAQGGLQLYVQEGKECVHYDWSGVKTENSEQLRLQRSWHIYEADGSKTALWGVIGIAKGNMKKRLQR